MSLEVKALATSWPFMAMSSRVRSAAVSWFQTRGVSRAIAVATAKLSSSCAVKPPWPEGSCPAETFRRRFCRSRASELVSPAKLLAASSGSTAPK